MTRSQTGKGDVTTNMLLHNAEGATEPVTVFALSGKRLQGGFAVANGRNGFVVKALGNTASELAAAAEQQLVLEPIHGRGQVEREQKLAFDGRLWNVKRKLKLDARCRRANAMAEFVVPLNARTRQCLKGPWMMAGLGTPSAE